MAAIDKFAAEVERFIKRNGMTPTAFGRDALRDPTFVFDLRNGRSVRTDTIDRVRDFMREHRNRAA